MLVEFQKFLTVLFFRILYFLAHIICSIIYPFPVVFANKAWTNITGYEQHEIVGQTLKLLQGPLTNVHRIQEMMENVRQTGSGDCEVVNYSKSGSPYLAKVQVQPSKLIDYTLDNIRPSLFRIFIRIAN